MDIKEFNEVYDMYMKKSKEELAMILTINDYNKSKETVITDKCDIDRGSFNLPKKTAEEHKPFNWSDPDMFRIHPEDGPLFKDKPVEVYCSYNSSGVCNRDGGLCADCPLYANVTTTTTTSDTTTSRGLLNFGLTDAGKTRCPLTKEMVDFHNNSECRECKLFGDCITSIQGVTNTSDDIKIEEGASTSRIGPYWMCGYEYCPFVQGGKCVKGDNRLCDGCEYNPQQSLKEYPIDSTTITGIDPNRFVFTNSTVNC